MNLILALLLVLLNAFFVAAEFAIVKVRETRIRERAEQGDRRAVVLLEVLRTLDATRWGSAGWASRPSPACSSSR